MVERSFWLAGVVCKTNEDPPPVQVRLAGGRSTNSGRLEVRYHGQWGTVCNWGWDRNDAKVVCRMLGYPGVQEYKTTNFRPVKGISWLSYVGCTGRETSIAGCSHLGWGNGCWHIYDVGVTCKLEEKEIKVRLVGDQNHTGKVEIQYQGTWGVVCDGNWDTQDAHVICRMLGYKAAVGSIDYIEGEKPRRMLLWNVRCSGRENSIAECSHTGWWNIPSWTGCSNKDLAGVVCKTNKYPPPVQVRLAGGRSANSGRLEVRYHGQWGTVCNRGWDRKDAEVVCRMLGYPGVQEYKTTNFRPVKGISWLYNVACTGTEISIADCSHNGWGNGCWHKWDVGVTCKMEEKAIDVRLVGEQSHTGKVEIQYQGTWGVVCDWGWGLLDAHVICRMLGYKAAVASIIYIEGETPRRILMFDVGCSGKENSIAECYHNGWWKRPSYTCTNKDLAGVVCQTNEEEAELDKYSKYVKT